MDILISPFYPTAPPSVAFVVIYPLSCIIYPSPLSERSVIHLDSACARHPPESRLRRLSLMDFHIHVIYDFLILSMNYIFVILSIYSQKLIARTMNIKISLKTIRRLIRNNWKGQYICIN